MSESPTSIESIIASASVEFKAAVSDLFNGPRKRWLDKNESAQRCGISVKYLGERCNAGTGPKFTRLGKAWRAFDEDLDAWMRSQPRAPESN